MLLVSKCIDKFKIRSVRPNFDKDHLSLSQINKHSVLYSIGILNVTERERKKKPQKKNIWPG